MKDNKVQKARRVVKKNPHDLKPALGKNANTVNTPLLALEETRDSSSMKKIELFSHPEKKSPSFSLANKENVDTNSEYRHEKKAALETPNAPSRLSNLQSTAASRLDFGLASSQAQEEASLGEGRMPRKCSRRSKAKRVVSRPSRKVIKKNEDGKRLYKEYYLLVDNKTGQNEYFKLYKDSEVGFNRDLQDVIQESVAFPVNVEL